MRKKSTCKSCNKPEYKRTTNSLSKYAWSSCDYCPKQNLNEFFAGVG